MSDGAEEHPIIARLNRVAGGIADICLIFSLVTVVAVYIVADRVFDYAVRAWEDGDKTIYLHIPRYLIVGPITAMIYLSALFAGFRGLRLLLRPGRVLPDETGNRVPGE